MVIRKWSKKFFTLLPILKINLTQTKAYKHFHYQRGFVHDKKKHHVSGSIVITINIKTK